MRLYILAGDMLQRWSNNTFKSTLHRVVSKTPGIERLSCAYFVSPKFDAKVSSPAQDPFLAEARHPGSTIHFKSRCNLDVENRFDHDLACGFPKIRSTVEQVGSPGVLPPSPSN
jgi:isopenicillin N synthase-like dioxygenase